MQIKQYVSILFLILLTAWYAGCTKHAEGIAGPAGPAGPAGANGTSVKPSPITGYVDLYNQYGSPDTSAAGVVVSTLKGDTLMTVTTDASGKFSMPPLPSGNYDIHFKKTGYDSLKVFIQHSGGDEPKFIGIVRIDGTLTRKFTNETLSIQQNPFFGGNVLFVDISFNGAPSTNQTLANFSFYFSRSKNPGTSNYDAMTLGNLQATNTNSYQLQYGLGNITTGGITYSPGDTVYMKTYISPPVNSARSWFDYATYRTVSYPYLGDSLVKYFVWPN